MHNDAQIYQMQHFPPCGDLGRGRGVASDGLKSDSRSTGSVRSEGSASCTCNTKKKVEKCKRENIAMLCHNQTAEKECGTTKPQSHGAHVSIPGFDPNINRGHCQQF